MWCGAETRSVGWPFSGGAALELALEPFDVAGVLPQLLVGGAFTDAGQGLADGLRAVVRDTRRDQRVHDVQLSRPARATTPSKGMAAAGREQARRPAVGRYTPPLVSAIDGILVTGGAGFVGATLVRRLMASGYRVRVLDNLSTGDAAHLAGVDAELVKGDIRDAAALDDALEGMGAIIHLAAAGSVIGSVQDPGTNFEVNVIGTFRVLDAARRAGVERVVLASTGGALIGDATPPVNERSLPKPISPYGASKLAGEGYAHAFAKTYGVRTVAIRFGNVYGPWCARKRGVLNVFFESIHSGVPLIIYGDGSASRDYVHVDDISNALQLALEKDVPGGTVLHAASGVETAVRDLADLCRRAAGAPDYPVEYRPKRAGEVGRNFASYELANQILGYAPSVVREVGIPRTWKWFQQEVFRD